MRGGLAQLNASTDAAQIATVWWRDGFASPLAGSLRCLCVIRTAELATRFVDAAPIMNSGGLCSARKCASVPSLSHLLAFASLQPSEVRPS